VNAQTIRFYERRGILPSAAREANGYRQYDEATASLLRFIRASQAAGLSLTDIGSIMSLRQSGAVPCEHVATLLTVALEVVGVMLGLPLADPVIRIVIPLALHIISTS
jgi:MerR family mercuric resistance operon transcriptional regulator